MRSSAAAGQRASQDAEQAAKQSGRSSELIVNQCLTWSIELGLANTVRVPTLKHSDDVQMWAEAEHGIPMTEYFAHLSSPYLGLFHLGSGLWAML